MYYVKLKREKFAIKLSGEAGNLQKPYLLHTTCLHLRLVLVFRSVQPIIENERQLIRYSFVTL